MSKCLNKSGSKCVTGIQQYSQISRLKLCRNCFDDVGVEYLADLKDSKVTYLDLSFNNISDKDVKSLVLHLKDSRVTYLNLSFNNISDEDVKSLALHLKNSKVTYLNLHSNKIGDEGSKYLAEIIKDSNITNLILTKNYIGIKGTQYLMLTKYLTKKVILHLDVKFDECSFIKIISYSENDIKIISYNSENDIEARVYLVDKWLAGADDANYLNQIFKNITIIDLTIDFSTFVMHDPQYLAQAFNNIKIMNLIVKNKQIISGAQTTRLLIKILKNSKIIRLIAQDYYAGGTDTAKFVADILKEINFIELDISRNRIRNEGVKHLVQSLKNNTIRKLSLCSCDIGDNGVKYLAEVLKDTDIINVDLSDNRIGTDGAKYLANGLKNSQVTHLNLEGNEIKYKGYQYFFDTIEDTNLSWINLNFNALEKVLGKGDELYSYTLSRSDITLVGNIKNAFKELVSQNSLTMEFKFTVPKRNNSTVDISSYGFLIKSLSDNPNFNIHIYYMYRNDNHVYDFNIMSNIIKFITKIEDKFNTFINGNLPDLLLIFDSCNFVNIVKQFQNMQAYTVVQNLLLHRELYYIDENQEILHPYIYKMLKKYNMPLFSETLEPNKKEAFISYFKNNSDIDDAQEIIDLLGSISSQ